MLSINSRILTEQIKGNLDSKDQSNVVTLPIKPLVLVVDDDAINRKIWSEVLRGLCRLEIASDGKQALELFERRRPALVVLDRMMPGMHGDEVLARIRALDPEGETRVVMHSMMETSSEQIEGMNKGADLYIPKSTDIDVAVTHIQSLLRLQKQSQAAALFKVARDQNRKRSYSSRLISEGIFRHAALLTEDIRAHEVRLDFIIEVVTTMASNVDGNAAIDLHLDKSAFDAVILGDEDLLTHALLSVIQRACEVTPKNKTVNVEMSQKDGNYVICVADAGGTLPPEEWNDLFHFICNPEKIQVGLPIAWETAQRHFGDLKASAAEEGMAFTFLFPTPEHLEELLSL